MHCGREGMVWELRLGKEKELQKKKKKKDFYWFALYLQHKFTL